MTTRAQSTAAQIAVLQTEVRHMTAQLAELSAVVTKLAEVDRALRLLISIIKWAGGLVVGMAGLWAAWRGQ